MIKKSFFIALLSLGMLSLNSCRDTTEKKTVIREVKEEPADVDINVEEEEKGILERAGEQIDEEVNQEVNEEIEKIGDDNQ